MSNTTTRNSYMDNWTDEDWDYRLAGTFHNEARSLAYGYYIANPQTQYADQALFPLMAQMNLSHANPTFNLSMISVLEDVFRLYRKHDPNHVFVPAVQVF